MEQLGALFHWTLKKNRVEVLRSGLLAMSPALLCPARFPWICLCPTPSRAWSLCAGSTAPEVLDPDGEDVWDLWQVRLVDTDEVHFLPQWGSVIQEVRVHNSIPADRVWWVGERMLWAHDTLPADPASGSA